MAVSEFALIQRFFTAPALRNPLNQLGVGDDCALIKLPADSEMAVTVDTMVEGVHFFPQADPEQLGEKLLAVNLSDLAAMGASPVSATLALTLPEVNESWLQAFASGLQKMAERYGLDLIGGDTTRGPLTLSLQLMGWLPKNKAMKRSGAQAGDLIFVTGSGLGDAGLGLKIEQGLSIQNPEQALKKFHSPVPRITEGLRIRSYASACIDLSDGIASDLQHILDKSQVGALLDWDNIPLSSSVKEYIQQTDDWQLPLSAGEDYELCFTISPEHLDELDIACTQVGVIDAQAGLRIQRNGQIQTLGVKGFEHFS